MHLLRTERFKKDFKNLPIEMQNRAETSLELLLSNPRHPSLQLKKMQGTPGVWELRVSSHYRVTLEYVPDGILLRRVGSHAILRRP
jgi:mRNA interferase RelE/StbE